MRPRFSLKIQLVVLFFLILGIPLTSLSLYLYDFFAEIDEREFDESLVTFVKEVEESIDFKLLDSSALGSKLDLEERKIFPFSVKKSFINIYDIHGKIVASNYDLKERHLLRPSEESIEIISELPEKFIISTTKIKRNSSSFKKNYREIQYISVGENRKSYLIQIAVLYKFVDSNKQKLKSKLIVLMPMILIFSLVAGFIFVSGMLIPIKNIINTSKLINSKDLSKRIEVPKKQDEIYELIITLNGLFERLEEALKQNERFIASASHQLKTPLAIIKSELESFSKAKSEEEKENYIESMKEEVTGLSTLVQDLLFLSEIERGHIENKELEKISLDEVIFRVLDSLSILGKNKKISFDFQIDKKISDESVLEIYGSKNLLVSLFTSLVDNSIKYSPEEEKVKICITYKEQLKSVVVIIENKIACKRPIDVKKIFEPFHRSGDQDSAKGSGLGLYIAKKISDYHNFFIDVIVKEETFKVSLVIKKN